MLVQIISLKMIAMLTRSLGEELEVVCLAMESTRDFANYRYNLGYVGLIWCQSSELSFL